jgi:UDP-N-acetylglucosamine 1-carboxyvinyltransferase
MHVYAAEQVGAEIVCGEIVCQKLCGADIVFNKISVGATVNAILLTVGAEGRSRIYGYAKEPHVIALIDFLKSAGACIEVSDECITLEGRELASAECEIIGDMIEAGTYISLSLMLGADLKIYGADRNHLSSFIDSLIDGGAIFEFGDGFIKPRGKIWEEMNVVAAPYPAFPTDLQPETAPLMARYMGGKITDTVWKRRFGYLNELAKFGVGYDLCENTARINPSILHSATASAPDLRGGVALVMCALMAKGESIIDNSAAVKRGYGNLTDKLRRLGADIEER